MKTAIFGVILVGVFSVVCCPAFAQRGGKGADVLVQGYTRADGTYVQPYMRSAPDGNVYNNWSTSGNYNPYTGQFGTKNPAPYGSASPYYVPPLGLTIQDQLQTWIGHSSFELNEHFGPPYKTHKQKDGYSVEYANFNQRIEFFFDAFGTVYKWKTWAYNF